MTPSLPELTPSALKPGAAVRILPAGLFRSWDVRPVGIPGWRMDSVIAKAVIVVGSRGSNDFMIDYEHQSINATKNGQPAPAAGWFKRLEWREGDGLYMADITWTETARAMIAAKEYRHVSPVFGYDANTGAVTYVTSVALTNTPGLTGLTDLAAARAALTAKSGGTPDITPDDRARLAHWFGYCPVTGMPQPDSLALARAQQETPDMAAMTTDERANYLRVFGPAFDAIGRPLG